MSLLSHKERSRYVLSTLPSKQSKLAFPHRFALFRWNPICPNLEKIRYLETSNAFEGIESSNIMNKHATSPLQQLTDATFTFVDPKCVAGSVTC